MQRQALDPDDVAGIYDELIDTYEAEWDRQGHMSLHLEYYDDDHDDPASASINAMRVLSEAAEIDDSDRVLNIGCGAGEDSVWNARAYGTEVVGINISETQLDLARENARDHGVDELTTFRYDDFHDLETVDDDSIDVVWGLEALSHSPDRRQVMEQVRRVLAPDGRVAFSDLFLRTDDVSGTDEDRIQRVNDGLGVRLGPISTFEETLQDLGFEAIEIRERTSAIQPCTERRHKFARLAHPAGRLLRVFGVFSDTQLDAFKASSLMHKLVASGTLGYYVITATRGPSE
jgi:cyclopropane fatty-acyl-phospholipid synthase-like methyltransferase